MLVTPSDRSDSAGPDPRRVHTGGGAYFEGGVRTDRGTIVAGNQTINYQLDIDKLIAALRQALPANDPEPERLLAALQEFQRLHEHLYEWKELHNFLNDVVMTVDQFADQVERMDAVGHIADPRAIPRQWRPVALKVDLLLDWAATVKHIAAPPFKQLPDGGMTGPAWAVDLQAARVRVGEMLERGGFDLPYLYDATAAFVDAAARHMYLVDKRLRDTAGDLYGLSREVLRNVNRG